MRTLILIAFTALVISSCGPRGNRQASGTEPGAPGTIAAFPLFEDGSALLQPYSLGPGELTSEDALMSAFYGPEDDFTREPTPATDAFYFPEADIRDEELVRTVRLRYNYATLYNRVMVSYEWFRRASSGGDDDDSITRKDTLDWIRSMRPELPHAFLDDALPDAGARSLARGLLAAYDRFDGDDGEASPFSQAVRSYMDGLSRLPELVDQDGIQAFEDRFWEWYDKKAVISDIDSLVRMNMSGYAGEKPSEGQLENMRRAIGAERDIDRRTILALEYVKFDRRNGVLLLGEILESRVYSKYLLEAWISWRANAQMEHSPSSFTVIANNYFDRMRVVTLDTMVRHCLESGDRNAECLIENLIFCEIVHRMGSLAGNSSFNTCAMLSFNMFIHPRLLPEEEE